ncbi:Armadillo-like helical [Corchorus olitorius]|uniref:Armadillo-like helical n=1 Tax=Corchorus olitorius TaxID=93759 RepID=A0A1R3KHQ0_9ROSI|nr:Armadillo-like helical [Corchorus olitorius]
MDDDAPLASEITARRLRRTRVQIRGGGDEPSKENGNSGENQERSSDASDGSPNPEEREGSPDDFEEIRPKAKRNRVAEETSDAPNIPNERLIEVIKGDGKRIPQVVKRWVERYEKDPKPAMVELLMMLFEACGAKYYIKEEFLDETGVDAVVVALVNLARNGEVEDYQSSKRKEFKNFKENLCSFLDNLVIECQNGPLFDKDLFDKFLDYIIALSCTPPRVYRQVASLMGLQLVTSFISVAKRLAAQRDTTQRQLNAERKKRVDGPRVESLNNRLSATHEQTLEMDEMMRKIFTGLFVHRYRDIDPNIRMSCIQSLGVWVLSYPTLFLADLYLKYFGWTLNDKSAGVRKAAVLALQNLYEVEDNVPTLNLFTERFSSRMIELADDIDVSVAVCAIGLVKQLLRHQLIPDDDLGSLYDLLIDDPPEIRRAIGELVYDHLIAQKFNSSQSGSKGNGSEVHLGRMLQILREFSTDPILSIYVIDDVWEYMKAMKDWKCIISMLLDENPLIELTDEDATNLSRLLFASVRKAVGERIVPASDNRKQYYNKAQRLIKDAFFKHGEKDALRSCVKAINFCCTESRGELQDFARNKLKELEDELIDKLKSAIEEVTDGGDEYSLLVNLKRLYELQLSRPVRIETYGNSITILHSFRNSEEEVVRFLLLNMYLDVAWSLHSIINSETVSEGSLSSLLSKRDTLLEELEYFLNAPREVEEGGKFGNQLACRVCTILADVWSLFRKANFLSTKLERLGYSPDGPVLQKFWRLCEQQLNTSDETEDEDANKEYIEETNRDAVMIAAAKLIANSTVPKDYLAPEIISHFVMHGAGITEIVKGLITVLKKKDEDISAYNRYVEFSKGDDESLKSESFQECKDLAARLAGIFVGAARNKHRPEILKIVKEGIEYAFEDAPKQLSFLEASVLHFASRLAVPDIRDILKDVQKRTENVDTDEDPSGWRPYNKFYDILQEKCAKNEGVQDEKEGTAAKRRGRPRKRRNIEGKRLFDEHSSSEEEDSISVSDQEDAQGEGDKEDEEEEDDAPLIHALKSSKLRSLRVAREENRGQSRAGASGRS